MNYFINFCVVYCCLAGSGVFSAAVSKLPPNFKICKLSSPDHQQCLTSAIEAAAKELRKGYAPLGIYPVDPLTITALDIDQGSGPVSINLKFRNLVIEGVSDVKLSNLKLDMKQYRISAKGQIPKLVLHGGYIADGRVLILPIKGDGQCELVLDDVTADIVLMGKEVVKDGVKFMKINRFDFKFDTTKLQMKLENLFNGDKALGDNMNRFLNENWRDILKELKPSIQEAFGIAFADITNRIFTKVPVDQIFPQ